MPYDNDYDRFRDRSRYKAKHSYRGSKPGDNSWQGDSRNGYVETCAPVNPQAPSPTPKVQSRPVKKKGHVGSKILIVLLVVLAAFAIAFGMFAAKVDANLHSFPPEEKASLNTVLAPSALLGVQPTTFLLLGSDARADDPGMGARTDAIVLARVDPNTKTVSMISIPRDTMVELDGYGTNKINSAYTFGGPSGAAKAVERLCGVKVDHVAVIDFGGLAALVDAIGGIDVHLDEPIDNPKAGDATLPTGDVHINGAQALVMSRDRDYADGDYTRQANQRKVISGILHRIMTLSPLEMPAAIEGISKCVATDDGTGTLGLCLTALRMKVPWAKMSVKMTVLPSYPDYIDGVSYVIADEIPMKELLTRFEGGGDIEAPLSSQ